MLYCRTSFQWCHHSYVTENVTKITPQFFSILDPLPPPLIKISGYISGRIQRFLSSTYYMLFNSFEITCFLHIGCITEINLRFWAELEKWAKFQIAKNPVIFADYVEIEYFYRKINFKIPSLKVFKTFIICMKGKFIDPVFVSSSLEKNTVFLKCCLSTSDVVIKFAKPQY